MNKSSFFIVGQHAVIEALKNPKRKVQQLIRGRVQLCDRTPMRNKTNETECHGTSQTR